MKDAHVNLSMLRVLVAVAEHHSFSRAAECVGMTQSGVSHAMRAVEDAAGSPLVSRNRHCVTLTEAGRRAVEEARLALDAVHRLCEAGRGEAAARGRARVGLVASAAAQLAPAALRELRRGHPGVEPEVLEGADQEVRRWVEGGIVDLGVGAASTRQLRTDLLVEDEFLLVAPEGHPLLCGNSVRLHDLRDATFVMSESGCEPAVRAMLRRAGVTVRIGLRVRDTGALLAMVRAGLGVSILPALALPALPSSAAFTRRLLPASSRRLLLLRRSVLLTPAAEAMRQAFLHTARGHVAAKPSQITT